MADGFARRVWTRVQSWFVANAGHMTVAFLPEVNGQALHPGRGYLRIWLAEGFLARQRTWGNQHFPALHGGVSLNILGAQATFSSFSRPPQSWAVPGAHLDFQLTPLLPYSGGTVEIEAALYQASTQGPLSTAVDLIGGLASLMGPPLATAAQIADKLSDGLDAVLDATGDQPVLGMHYTMVAPGGAGATTRPGLIVLIGAAQSDIPGMPVINNGRLHLRTPEGDRLPTGFDYLVVRVECRPDRDDWRFPELDSLIRAAGEAFIRGETETFTARSTDAIARAWNSVDLTPVDRKRVALLVKDELDGLGELGVVPGGDRALHNIAPKRLPAADDHRLIGLTLNELLSG
jgi:hypothetical protein